MHERITGFTNVLAQKHAIERINGTLLPFRCDA